MAKIGPQEDGRTDPFNQLGSKLALLEQPQPANDPTPAIRPLPAQVTTTERSEPVTKQVTPQQVGQRPAVGEGGQAPRTITHASTDLKLTMRFKTTADEKTKIEQAATRLSAQLGTATDFSKITRALWELYLRHEDDVLRNVPPDSVWKRPRNGDTVAMAEFDQRLADLMHEGLMIACRRPQNRGGQ